MTYEEQQLREELNRVQEEDKTLTKRFYECMSGQAIWREGERQQISSKFEANSETIRHLEKRIFALEFARMGEA